MTRPSRTAYAVTVFLILLISYGYFLPRWADWGANSRANVVYAFVDQGVLHIDDYHENTGDKACYPGPYDLATDTCNGHYYTDKSLGPSLVAVPFYAVFRQIAAIPPVARFIENGSGLGNFSDTLNPEGEGIRPEAVYEGMALTFMTLFAMAVPSALMGTVLFLFADRFATRRLYAVILALAYGLATIALPYSNALYQHQMAAFGAFVGFFLLWRVIYEQANRNWLWLVGVLFSLTVITEYPAVVILGIIFLWAVAIMPDRWQLYRVVLGAIPLGLVFMAFNYAQFESIMPVGYSYSTLWQDEHQEGFLSLTIPNLERIYGLTFSPVRGIFLISPFLLLFFPGLYLMWRERPRARGMVIALALVVLAFFMYNAASIMWWGGFTIGPRYLIPMLPFMALPIIFTLNALFEHVWGRVLGGALIGLSLLHVWALHIAGQGWPPLEGFPQTIAQMNATFPLTDYALPLLSQGNIGRNYGGIILGLDGLAGLIPLVLAILIVWLLVPRWLTRQPMQTTPTLEQATEAGN